MYPQIACPRIGKVTLVAFVWLFSRVNLFMFLKAAILSERFSTQGAFSPVWLRMWHLMLLICENAFSQELQECGLLCEQVCELHWTFYHIVCIDVVFLLNEFFCALLMCLIGWSSSDIQGSCMTVHQFTRWHWSYFRVFSRCETLCAKLCVMCPDWRISLDIPCIWKVYHLPPTSF